MRLADQRRRIRQWCRCAFVAAVLLLPPTARALAAEPCPVPQTAANAAQRSHGLDPRSPLRTRVAPPSAEAVESYRASGVAFARPHRVTATQMDRVDRALASLPALHRRVLQRHLRHLSFIDVPVGAGSGLTARISDGDFPLFDLTLRAGILDERLSEFLTTKERTVFSPDGSGTTVSVEAPTDALTYVLLHEATHIVDQALGLTTGLGARFTRGIWLDRRELDAPWAASPIAGTAFRRAPRVPVSSAPSLYRALSGSPFASLYATAAAPEDFAELVAWRQLSLRAPQPLRIRVRDSSGALLYQLEPLRNARLARRFAAVDALLESCADEMPPQRGP